MNYRAGTDGQCCICMESVNEYNKIIYYFIICYESLKKYRAIFLNINFATAFISEFFKEVYFRPQIFILTNLIKNEISRVCQRVVHIEALF
uniref:Uncharacterized protein n=1 Tax=Heterorhabditis bacteriophora TaxID=37862 RepID=A0A1I7WYW9_HETBA